VATFRRNNTVKNLLIREKLIEYKCDICEQESTWNGEPLTLELDHIDGNAFDNRIENLRFLCPNCHSQTPTSKGKNTKGIKKCRKEKKE